MFSWWKHLFLKSDVEMLYWRLLFFFFFNLMMVWNKKNRVWGRHGRLKMSLKIHLRIDETEIYRWRGFKVEGKSLQKLKNELIIVFFHDFLYFCVVECHKPFGETGRTDNVPDLRVCYCNQHPNWKSKQSEVNAGLVLEGEACVGCLRY